MGTLRIISHSSKPFSGRIEAGRLLAGQLSEFRSQKPAVLGIPRGGIIIAQQIADVLEADLDIILSHKLGAPGNPELAIGAVCEDGKLFIDQRISSYVGADGDYIEQEKARQLQQIARRIERYREVLPKLPLQAKVVIITDDGVATGATMQAALWAVRQERPQKLVAALPVGPEDTLKKLAEDADETICLQAPPFFSALSQFYSQFAQVEDEELLEILEAESERRIK
ncbi:MAG: phosphoribosyltransferase [Sedimentisphaerales bacterium]